MIDAPRLRRNAEMQPPDDEEEDSLEAIRERDERRADYEDWLSDKMKEEGKDGRTEALRGSDAARNGG